MFFTTSRCFQTSLCSEMHFKKILCSADSQKAVLVNVKNDLEQKNSKVVGGFVLNKINWHSNEKNLH